MPRGHALISADSDVGLPCQRAGGEGCQQLKWLASGAGIALFSIVLAGLLGCLVFSAGLAALLVGIGMGILKYRVYDMDRIISRTLACAIVTGLLAGGVRRAGAAGRPGVRGPRAGGGGRLHAGGRDSARSATAAGAAAAARRFSRAWYDARQAAAVFAARLKDAVDLDAVRDDLASAVHQPPEPAQVPVRISQRDCAWLPPALPPSGSAP